MMQKYFHSNEKPQFIIDIYTIGYTCKGESNLILIESNDGKFNYNILIDLYDNGDETVSKILREKKKKLNLICISHYHDDHLKGIEKILDEFTTPCTTTLIPDTDEPKALKTRSKIVRKKVSNICRNNKKKNGTIKKITEPEMCILDEIHSYDDNDVLFSIYTKTPFSSITACNIDRNLKNIQQNDYAISLDINLGEFHMFFSSDIMKNSINKMSELGYIHYLKIPHHGSSHSLNIFDKINIGKNTRCAVTNFKSKGLPEKPILDSYLHNTPYVYRINDCSENICGIIHMKIKYNAADGRIFFQENLIDAALC
ncbi:MAG: hypothetical protein PHN42_02765 [Bacilli bacterium]|nr:hypothetical protein [Bacilli bacterium]